MGAVSRFDDVGFVKEMDILSYLKMDGVFAKLKIFHLRERGLGSPGMARNFPNHRAVMEGQTKKKRKKRW